MINKIENSLYRMVPAVICTAGSYIAATNSLALEDIKRLSQGQLLYDSMGPEDILKYEADFLSGKDRISGAFNLSDFYGYRFGVALFKRLLGKSFAVVFLFKSLSSLEYENIRDELSRYDILNDRLFFEDYIRISYHKDVHSSDSDENRLINMYDMCRLSVVEMSKRREIYNFDISFVESDSMKDCYSYIPLKTLFQIMFLSAAVVGEITLERRMEVKASKYGEDFEIRIRCDSGRVSSPVNSLAQISELVPSAASYITTCEYAALRAGCTSFVISSKESKELSLVFTFGKSEIDHVDFKSPMKEEGILGDCAFVFDKISKM